MDVRELSAPVSCFSVSLVWCFRIDLVVKIIGKCLNDLRYPKDNDKHVLAIKSGLTRSQVLRLTMVDSWSSAFCIHHMNAGCV